MDNYYKRPSPQEMRYRDVLRAISQLGPTAKELALELDEVVWQIVSRAVDAALVDNDRRAPELLLDRLYRGQTADAEERPGASTRR
jgi:hypothetical protein